MKLQFSINEDQLDALSKHVARWSLIAISIVIAFVLLVFLLSAAHAQTPLQAQSQVYTNQFPSGPVTNAVVDGTTNKVPMQPWTVQEIKVITILESQRSEMRVTLPTMPLLSLKTNVTAEDVRERKRSATQYPVPLGPPAPPKTKPKPQKPRQQ